MYALEKFELGPTLSQRQCHRLDGTLSPQAWHEADSLMVLAKITLQDSLPVGT